MKKRKKNDDFPKRYENKIKFTLELKAKAKLKKS